MHPNPQAAAREEEYRILTWRSSYLVRKGNVSFSVVDAALKINCITEGSKRYPGTEEERWKDEREERRREGE